MPPLHNEIFAHVLAIYPLREMLWQMLDHDADSYNYLENNWKFKCCGNDMGTKLERMQVLTLTEPAEMLATVAKMTGKSQAIPIHGSTIHEYDFQLSADTVECTIRREVVAVPVQLLLYPWPPNSNSCHHELSDHPYRFVPI